MARYYNNQPHRRNTRYGLIKYKKKTDSKYCVFTRGENCCKYLTGKKNIYI